MRTVKMQVAENLSVAITPNKEHEFVMSTSEVARGYGVSTGAIRMQQDRNCKELIEGKHFVKGVTIRDTLADESVQPHQVFWTKRGIVRLGFFIKSERAKMFRDWAEDLILSTMEHAERIQQLKLFPELPKRKHNRLTPERIISIISDVAKIEDTNLRMTIIDKLTNC